MAKRKVHGALSNPPGRFNRERVEPVDDGWYLEEEGTISVPETLEPDHARSIITRNDSPDVPFDNSINPYRGCAHACSYCVHADTPILMGDGTVRSIKSVHVGDEVYGTVRHGWYLRYTKTRVLDHWCVIKPAYRITLEDGTRLVASGDHRFLTERGWKFVTGTMGTSDLQRPHLTTNNKLMGTGAFAPPPQNDLEYRRGYLCGLIRGDGMIFSRVYEGRAGRRWRADQFRLALCDFEALGRAETWLYYSYVDSRRFLFSAASQARRPLHAIRTSGKSKLDIIRELIAWPASPHKNWSAGFLAGIFDAEGSYSNGILRISNTDRQIIDRLSNALQVFGFRFVVEHIAHTDRKPIDVVRIVGGLPEHLRFFHSTDPAIARKRDISGQAVKSEARLQVVCVESLNKAMRLYDITTGTGDFIANGVVSHNCYARPSHSYMGLSPGLDFETRLFFKQNAAELLEAELARPGYVCKPIALGTNTDPYQPVERRLRVTRSILEVLARCRHPVTIVTKSALVLRDLDLLGDLARDGLVNVALSVTTLDAQLKRALEPRAASPQARLRAVYELAGARVPTGVMVAPVIPALTDHELESIIDAAADAGALWAAYVVLRLPYEVKDLFREWLARHYPDRARHVMSIVQSLRGGRDNDPRFGSRMRGTGPFGELLRARFELACRRRGLGGGRILPLATSHFRPPRQPANQLSLEL